MENLRSSFACSQVTACLNIFLVGNTMWKQGLVLIFFLMENCLLSEDFLPT